MTYYKKITIIVVVFLLNTGLLHASFYKNLWQRWTINNPLSTKVISHALWQKFLDRHLSTNQEQINLIDYPNIGHDDMMLLQKYIQDMSHIDIDNYNRNEQLAFWINLYNALTVQTVAHYYPITNIQEIRISPGLFSVGPWGANLITVQNIPLSLDDINNRIIRPIWNDPRALYTLNNATIGAPNLNKASYSGIDIEKRLNQAASTYINSLRGAQVIEGELIISKLYDWYEEDFGGTKQDVIQHLVIYAKEPLKSQLKHINSIDSYVYNWHINNPPL